MGGFESELKSSPAACWAEPLADHTQVLGKEEEIGRGLSLVLSQGWGEKQISQWEERWALWFWRAGPSPGRV